MFRSICIAACVLAVLAAGCVSQQTHQKKVDELNGQIQQLKTESAAQAIQMQTLNLQLVRELTDTQKSLNDAKLANDALAKKCDTIDSQTVEPAGKTPGVTADHAGNAQLTVSFKLGGIEITPDEKAAVQKFAATLAGQDGQVFVDGHGDNMAVSNPETRRLYGDNLGLSLMRAATVARALADAGVPQKSIIVRGFGSNMPVASNDDAEGRAKNRRVEIFFMPASKEAQTTPPADQPAQEPAKPDTGKEEK